MDPTLPGRIDELERKLHALAAELAEVRALASPAVAPPPPAAIQTAPPPPPPARPPAFPVSAAVGQARARLEAGNPAAAIARLERGIGESSASWVLLAIAAELDSIAASEPEHAGTARMLAARARKRADTAPPETAAAAEAPSPGPVPPPRPPRQPSPSLAELAERYEILGPRGFAIAGGAVTALGVVLLFVLAANRGWIGPGERVALGGIASGLVFAVGILLRARYGQYAAALGAVGAGIAGAYATLAAAAALYDLVPDGLALPLAAVIAGAATAVSLWWSSEIVAGLGLVGSALAPALESIDTGMTPGSAAFAVIVLAATGAVAVPRDWQWLLGVVALVVGAQTIALALRSDAPGDTATIAVCGSLALVTLVIGCSLQWRFGQRELVPAALPLVLAAAGFTLGAAALLFEKGSDRGIALATAAAVWGAAWLSARRPQPDLGLVLGVSALALGAVATGNLLSDDALTLAWAAQATLLAVLAWKLRDVRLALMGYAYLLLATGHALAVDAPLRVLFEPLDASAVAALAPAACALAATVAGILLAREYDDRGETGMLAWMADVRTALTDVRRPLQETLLFGAGAVGTYAAAVLLVGISFQAGHIASSGIAAAAAAGCVGFAARRRSASLIVAGMAALAVVLTEAVGFDIDEFLDDEDLSAGGWSVLLAAAGLLAGGVALRILHPTERRLGVASGFAASLAFLAGNLALAFVTPVDADGDVDLVVLGLGFALVALVYLVLAGAVFRIGRLRNLSTTLWALGVIGVLEAEAAFADGAEWTLFAYAATAAVLAALSWRTCEPRLWLAGLSLAGVTTLWTFSAVTTPVDFLQASTAPAEDLWVLAGCVTALVVLAITAPMYKSAVAGVAAGLGLFGLSLVILELAQRVSGASVDTDFERGHTAVSAVWALLGLGLLVAGLLRGATLLRVGGLALFGVSLGKIFVFDLSELSSVARALSFLVVGALLLAGGFFLQRLSEHLGPRQGAST